MRFMMIMVPNIPDEENWSPDPDAVANMGRFNEELVKAGVLLALDGLHPPVKGARVTFSGGSARRERRPLHRGQGDHRRLLDDRVSSKEEAVEWAPRCPAADGDMIEVRQVFEMSDFPQEVQEAAELDIRVLTQRPGTREQRAVEAVWRIESAG